MADFQYYLNRTGPRGPQGYKGDKGDDGKTPVPRTGTNTPIETTVIFDTGDGNPYETPNLKYPIEDRGGNVVMLDRANETQYYGTPDQATDNSYGVVKLATPKSVLDDPLDSDVVTYELFDDNNQAIKTVTDSLTGDITQLNTDLGTEVTNRSNADAQLTNKINTDVGNEATARSNADTALSGRIDNLTNVKANKSDVYTKTQTDSLLNNKSNVGHTHNYNEITNKPDIGNGTITITQGGVVKGSFTTNQLSNGTIALDAGGGGGGSSYAPGNGINITNDVISVKVDNDSIYVNQDGELVANLEDITEALGAILDGDASIFDDYYTKTQSDSRYVQDSTLATVATSGDYNDLSNKPTIPSTTNMVTTDSNQTISGAKTFSNSLAIKTSSYGGTFTPTGSGVLRYTSNSNYSEFGDGYIICTGAGGSSTVTINALDYYQSLVKFQSDSYNGRINYYRGNFVIASDKTSDTRIYKITGDGISPTINSNTNFLLEKSMLDGTTITYNSSTGKISAAGGSTPSNMVTTNTDQTITSEKTFANKVINFLDSSGSWSGHVITVGQGQISVGWNSHNMIWNTNSSSHQFSNGAQNVLYSYGTSTSAAGVVFGGGWRLYRCNSAQSAYYGPDQTTYPYIPYLDSEMLDGTYLKWDSSTKKITVDIQAIKDAIDALSSSSNAGEGSFNGGTQFGG